MSKKVRRLAEQILKAYVIGKTGGVKQQGFRRFLRLVGARRAKGHDQSEEVLRVEWMATDRLKQVAERPIQVVTRRIFERQRQAVVEGLRQRAENQRSGSGPSALKDPAIVSTLFDIQFWNEQFGSEIEPATLEAIRDGFQNALRRIGEEDLQDAFDASRPLVRRTVEDVEELSRLVNRQTQETISEIVQDGLNQGQGFNEIADRLNERFQNWKRWRSRMHARTAGTAAFEAGQEDGFDRADVPTKRWLTQRDARVRGLDADDRYDHASADGQEVPVGRPFEVSGELLRFPSDPNGSPGNTINCRCTQLPVLDD